jgi:hypothetical protein
VGGCVGVSTGFLVPEVRAGVSRQSCALEKDFLWGRARAQLDVAGYKRALVQIPEQYALRVPHYGLLNRRSLAVGTDSWCN